MKTTLPGLYIHVPFCRTKCPYCDFYSSTDLDRAQDFPAALAAELALYARQFPEVDTVYLGGGTPTALADAALAAIMDLVQRQCAVAPGAEITIEANPNDLSLERLRQLRAIGFNRLSLGAQSFSDSVLRFLGRRHTAREAAASIAQARKAGFDTISLDLMYALPGQAREDWLDDLGRALSFAPEHLSCYQLTIKERTPFYDRVQKNLLEPCPEQEQAALFLATADYLEFNGYTHYEVSNFCRAEALQARHNKKYWEHAPCLGLGPSAHSFDGRRRWWNVGSVEEYMHRLLVKEDAGLAGRTKNDSLDSRLPGNDNAPAIAGSGTDDGMPVGGSELLSDEQLRTEAIMLGMRMRAGIVRGLLPAQAAPVIEKLAAEGLVVLTAERLKPTTAGLLLADHIALRLAGAAGDCAEPPNFL
jgi:oxygen-independent coproporphyrinogen-3 oxidase